MREKMKHGAGKSGDGTESGLRRMKKAAGRTGAGILAQIRQMGRASVSLFHRSGSFSLSDRGDAEQAFRNCGNRISGTASAAVSVQFADRYRNAVSGPSVPEKGIRLCAGIADLAGTGHYKLCSAGIQDDSAECNGFQNV